MADEAIILGEVVVALITHDLDLGDVSELQTGCGAAAGDVLCWDKKSIRANKLIVRWKYRLVVVLWLLGRRNLTDIRVLVQQHSLCQHSGDNGLKIGRE